MPMRWGMLCNECLKRLTWRFVSKDSKGHLLTINAEVTSDGKKTPKVVQEKERNQKKNTQSSWGKCWQFPSFLQGQGGLSSAGRKSTDETAMYILPYFFPSIILLSSDLVKHPTLVVSSDRSLQLCWLEYVNQVQMKHIHWEFNFCAHLWLSNI